jgi:voltage-gated potassium channel
MSLVVQSGFHRKLKARRFARMLDELTQDFIIRRDGPIGSVIAEGFRRQGVPFVVVDRDAERGHDVILRGGPAVQADASPEGVPRRVGIPRARGLILAIGTDAENVKAVPTARGLRPDLFIAVRGDSEGAEATCRRAGAGRAVPACQPGAVQRAATALGPAVVHFMHQATSSERLNLAPEQVTITASAAFAGQSNEDANLRQAFGASVVAVTRRSGHMAFDPPPDARIAAEDQLVVHGHPDQVKALDAAAAGRAGPVAAE